MTEPRPPTLDYATRLRNPSLAMERRRRLVREAATLYARVLVLSVAVMTVLCLLIALWGQC